MIRQNIKDSLKAIIAKYLQDKGITDRLNFTLEIPPGNIDADFALNAAMLIAKKAKTKPRTVAQELIDITVKEIPELIEKAEIAGAGFINLRIKNEIFYKELETILREKDKYGSFPENNKEKILVEFVSANPTGPLHIGHGRGAAIGDSIARILKHLGYNVTKEYYLNDYGNQMLVLSKSAEIRFRQLKGEKIDFPADYYQGRYVIDIAKRLVSENRDRDIDEINFKYEAVKDILSGIKDNLKDFAVEFDDWFSESKITANKDKNGKTEVDKTCEYLLAKGDAYIKGGALWLASTKFGDDKDRVLKRSDGRYTYLASDTAYHKNKFERGFTKLVNLWGADHHGYVARIKACVQMLGFDKKVLDIILYQFVLLVRNGQSVIMSTRTGEFITLKEVVDEVGKDTCRFFFLLRAPDSQLEFDLELAKKQSSENPVFYVQYVNARCSSIIRESKNRSGITTEIKNINFSLLNTKEERDLIKQLAAFCDTLALSEKTMSPHHFTVYLIELADIFHKFYEKCRVLTDDTNLTSARLKLIESVAIIIKNGLNLLGISVPDKM
ncbi:MAG: arginine--tRNA ligase [Endomicrobium sp.]|jgi:arginyl-tRNA synthetase|nr:arginine--tRNA ligase [Endomicrobium sp.]